MINARFDAVAQGEPSAFAVVEGDARLTYADLARRVAALSGRLRREIGVRPGDVVAIALPSGWAFTAAFLAVARAGAASLVLDPASAAGDLLRVAHAVAVRAVLVGEAAPAAFRDASAAPRVVHLDDPDAWTSTAGGAASDAPDLGRCDEIAAYVLTSGSTGRPRVVGRTARALLAGAGNVARALGLRPGFRALCAMPFHHAFGLGNCVLLPALTGGAAFVSRPFTAATALDLVRRERLDVLPGSPVVFRALLAHGATRADVASVTTAYSSGAPMPEDAARAWLDRLGVRVRQMYGASEAGTICLEAEGDPILAGAVGRPVDGVELHLVGDDGQPVAAGEVGRVSVKSKAMARGYAGDPDADREAFVDGALRTGDLGRLDDAGRLVLAGRITRVINAGGLKIDPVEIEHAVEAMPGVACCRVDGVEDARTTQIVRAAIAVRAGHQVTRADVVAHCRRALGEHKIPRVIDFVPEIREEITGKKPVAWREQEPWRSPRSG